MSVAHIIFYSFAALAIAAGLFILFTKNILHAVLSLLVVFLGVSAIYVFAGADFLAVTQLVVYIGGVIVLMLFGVMLTNREGIKSDMSSSSSNAMTGTIVFLILFSILLYLIVKINFSEISHFRNGSMKSADSTTSIIGKSLMTDYNIAFELAGLLLLIALIGAVYIAGRKNMISDK